MSVFLVLTLSSVPVKGDVSEDVGTLQRRLLAKGFSPGIIDDDFGDKTEAAVSAFQKSIGLPGSGIIGPRTLEGLALVVVTVPTPAGPITRQVIADLIIANIQKDVSANLRETHGKNRSPRIDEFNRRTRVAMGSPYCMSGAWCAIDDACKALGLKNPVPATASSQAGYYLAPAKYQRHMGALKGDLAIFQQYDDPAHGHAMLVRENQVSGSNYFRTSEYNTGPDGSRDGDGAYNKTRAMSGTSSMKLRGFVNAPQWIFDQNLTQVRAA